jgi:hypothetical protein
MYGANYSTAANGSRTVRTTVPAAGGGGDDELNDILRERLRRAQEDADLAEAEARRPPERSWLAAAPARAAGGNHSGNPEGNRLARVAAMEEDAYKRRLREIDLNPPKKLVGTGFNQHAGYVTDFDAMPMSMRPKQATLDPSGPSMAGLDQGDQSVREGFATNPYSITGPDSPGGQNRIAQRQGDLTAASYGKERARQEARRRRRPVDEFEAEYDDEAYG